VGSQKLELIVEAMSLALPPAAPHTSPVNGTHPGEAFDALERVDHGIELLGLNVGLDLFHELPPLCPFS
jgi:hypothetical protein